MPLSSGPADHQPDSVPGLTAFQLEVAQLFFSLPASKGFLLAGGAALLAQRLTSRPTEDLDFFTAPGRGDVPAARNSLEEAARERGWRSERIEDSATFCRMIIHSDAGDLLTDLAVDSPPGHPGSVTIAGPTFDPEELAGRKLLALFDRAAARDFVDVYLLAQSYPKDALLVQAAEIDPGFDHRVLAEMIASIARFTDADLPIAEESVPEVRTFFKDWHSELAPGS